MKDSSYAIYQMMNNRSFRLRLEENMHQTLLDYGISLSRIEQEVLRDLLGMLPSSEKSSAMNYQNIPGLPDLGWPQPSLIGSGCGL